MMEGGPPDGLYALESHLYTRLLQTQQLTWAVALRNRAKACTSARTSARANVPTSTYTQDAHVHACTRPGKICTHMHMRERMHVRVCAYGHMSPPLHPTHRAQAKGLVQKTRLAYQIRVKAKQCTVIYIIYSIGRGKLAIAGYSSLLG